jgi:hypothetical protein
MAIGVSFIGHDGRKREGVANTANDLLGIMSAQGAPKVDQSFSAGDLLKSVKAKKPDPVDGPLVGVRGNDSLDPDGQQRAVGSMGGFRIPVSRTEMKVEPSLEMKRNKVTLVKLEYDLIFSESGLLKGRSVESKVWEKSFFVVSEGEESTACEYGVRAFWDNAKTDKPTLKLLAFGSAANLATYDNASGKFLCNYDEDGKLLETPPVKRVAVSACTNGVKG